MFSSETQGNNFRLDLSVTVIVIECSNKTREPIFKSIKKMFQVMCAQGVQSSVRE